MQLAARRPAQSSHPYHAYLPRPHTCATTRPLPTTKPADMLPFEAPTIFEQLPRFFFKMPRVVQDQKSKFESDELFRRISRESEVRQSFFFDFGVRVFGFVLSSCFNVGLSSISFAGQVHRLPRPAAGGAPDSLSECLPRRTHRSGE